MSIKVMVEVWDYAPFMGTELLVLVALADNANDSRECFPGLKHVARKARITIRQSINVLQEIALQGVITITPRKDGKHGNMSNMYYIKPVHEWDLLTEYHKDNPSETSNTPLVKPATLPHYTSEGENVIEPKENPKINHNTSAGAAKAPPKAPKATPTPKPMRLPDDVYKYQAKHIAQYQSEHSTSLDALVVAWGGLYRHITEMPLYDARQFVVAHQDLERMNIPPSDFGAIITTTRTKFAWRLLKGGRVNPSDIGATITDYLQAKQAQPSTSTSQADAQAEHAYREMFGKDMPHA